MKKLTIVLVACLVFTAFMSVASMNYSVLRTRDAIANLPEIKYNENAAAAVALADSYYDKMDTRLNIVGTPTEEEEETFLQAKVNYVRLCIKAASVADSRVKADDLSFDEVKALVDTARELADEYLTPEQQLLVENIDTLTELEEKYADSAGADSGEEEVAVQLC